MKALVQRRARIARVRRVQHMQAAAAATTATNQVLQLESSAERLSQLRGSLSVAPGPCSGASLSGAGELAMRLDNVRAGLTDAIVSARATAAERVEARLEARKRQESAEKLDSRAATALALMREARMQGNQMRRPDRFAKGEDE